MTILSLIVCVYVLSIHVSLSVRTSVRVFGYIIIVCLYVRPLIHPRFSFFLWIHQCLAIYVYIYICKTFDPYISVFLSECLNQCPAILSFIMCVYVGLLICVSLFVSECICVRLNYFTHCTCIYIYICMSLDSSMFLSLVVSECLYQCPAMLLLIVCIDICLLSHVSLTECVSVWLFYNSLYVCMFVSWSMFQIQIPRQKNFIIHNKSIKWNLSLRSLKFHSKMDRQLNTTRVRVH